MKQLIASFFRKRWFQPFWERMFTISKIGMNYWGGSSLYDSGEIAVLKSTAKIIGTDDGIVFDVGANAGQYAILARKILNEKAIIYSFEPSAPTYKSLLQNTADAKKTICFNVGLGSNQSERTLFFSSPGSTTATLYPTEQNASAINSMHSEQIQMTTIDSFCAEHGISKIHLLKIDVEGHELAVLQGASRMISEKRISNIQFEFGEFHIESRTFMKDFYQLLGSDAKFFRVVRDGLREMGGYNPGLEVFNTTNYLASLD